MNYRIMKHPCGVQRKVKIGFSWTTMFFDFWPSVFRGEWGSAIKLFLIGPLTFGIYNIFKWFSINNDYYESLLMKGFEDVSPKSWEKPQKESPIIQVYKTFLNANPIIYKKLKVDELSKKINIKPIFKVELIAKVQTALIGIYMILNIYNFFSNISNVGFGIGSLMDSIIDIFTYDIILLIIILLIVTVIMMVLAIDIDSEVNINIKEDYKKEDKNLDMKKESIETLTNEKIVVNEKNNRGNFKVEETKEIPINKVEEKSNYTKEEVKVKTVVVRKNSSAAVVIAIIELLIIIGLVIGIVSILNSQTYLNGEATTSTINAVTGNGSAQQAEQAIGNAVSNNGNVQQAEQSVSNALSNFANGGNGNNNNN